MIDAMQVYINVEKIQDIWIIFGDLLQLQVARYNQGSSIATSYPIELLNV